MHEIIKTEGQLWDLFTKKEEYDPPKLDDEFDEFTYYLSKHKSVLNPEVSRFLMKNKQKINYPHGKKFAVCLTHDIDLVCYPNLTMAFKVERALSKLQINQSLKKIPKKIYTNINRLWNFSQTMEIEKKYDAKSSFYFLALDKGEYDFRYNLEEVKDVLINIIENGFEVGLHGGPQAYNNLTVMKKEKKRLEKIINRQVIGYRNHYLKFRVPMTWEYLQEAGFKYDTTLGYIDHVGFRNGMCHPFEPWNLITNKKIKILELPLVIMDFSLVEFMHLNMENAWNMIKRLIDIGERYQGVITVLWHNSYMKDEMLELYEKMLRYCREQDAWITSGESIYNWWEQHGL